MRSCGRWEKAPTSRIPWNYRLSDIRSAGLCSGCVQQVKLVIVGTRDMVPEGADPLKAARTSAARPLADIAASWRSGPLLTHSRCGRGQ